MKVVLTGSNSYAVTQEQSGIITRFIKEHGSSIERFDGSEITTADGVLDAVRSISFLEPKKLVIVVDFAQSSELYERIEDIVEQTAESTDLLLVDQKLDKRTTAYKKLQSIAEVRVLSDLSVNELQAWVVSQASALESNISMTDARFLVERVGPNQQLLMREIEKLTISSSGISRDLIVEMVEPTPQSKVFTMLEYLFRGDSRNAWEMYLDQRSQGEEPQKLVAMITWQLQQLSMAVFAPNRSKQALLESGMSSYTAQKSIAMAVSISKNDIRHYIAELAGVDALSKINADIESALAVYFSDVALVSSAA